MRVRVFLIVCIATSAAAAQGWRVEWRTGARGTRDRVATGTRLGANVERIDSYVGNRRVCKSSSVMKHGVMRTVTRSEPGGAVEITRLWEQGPHIFHYSEKRSSLAAGQKLIVVGGGANFTIAKDADGEVEENHSRNKLPAEVLAPLVEHGRGILRDPRAPERRPLPPMPGMSATRPRN